MRDNILGLQSWSLRNFTDNNVMLPMLKELGVTATEICNRHVKFNDTQSHKDTVEIYKKHGVKIVSAGVNPIPALEAEARPYFEFIKASGAKHMSIDFKPEDLDAQLKTAEKLAEEYGITLGIHNHGGRHWLGNAEMLRFVFKKSSKRIGLSLDTAWAIHSQENVPKLIEEFKDRLYLMHLKDFFFERSGKVTEVPTGEGNLDLKALKTTLETIDYKGIFIIEYEAQPENPMEALKKCVKNVQQSLL